MYRKVKARGSTRGTDPRWGLDTASRLDSLEPRCLLSSLHPEADAMLTLLSPETNYGEYEYLGVLDNPLQTEYRSLIRFDVSGVPDNAVLGDVSLNMYSVTNSSSGYVSLQRVLGEWDESRVTWGSRPEISAEADALEHVSGLGWHQWSGPALTETIRAWISGDQPNYGWALVAERSNEEPAKMFNSREGTANLPYLTIDWRLPPGPDLASYSLDLSDTGPVAGQELSLSWVARNIGGDPAGQSVQALIWSSDTVLSDDDVVIGEIALPELASAQSLAQESALSVPADAEAGARYYIGVYQDWNDQVAEGSELNNLTWIALHVTLPRPTIGEVIATPNPVLWGQKLTLEALDVSDADGFVEKVSFFRDGNGNGMWDGASVDPWIGPAQEDGGAWRLEKIVPMSWGEGALSVFALARDNDGQWGPHAATTVEVVANTHPIVNDFDVSPDPVMWGQRIRFTAENVADPDGRVDKVSIFRDGNGNGLWDGADTDPFVGAAKLDHGVWRLARFVPMSWGEGETAFFAKAQDNNGNWGPEAADSAMIQRHYRPIINDLTASSDSVRWGERLTLTAGGVRDPDGSVEKVSIFRDGNGNGRWDGADVDPFMGPATRNGDVWRFSAVAQPEWTDGNVSFFAKAMDDSGLWGPHAQVSVWVEPNWRPIISNFSVSADTASAGDWVTLTASGVRDPDSDPIESVRFFLDDGDGKWEGGAYELRLSIDYDAADGWSIDYQLPADLATGQVTFWAIAKTTTGQWGWATFDTLQIVA